MQRLIPLARLALFLSLPACVQEAELPVLAPGGPARGEVPSLAFIGSHSEGELAVYLWPGEPEAPLRRLVDTVEGEWSTPPRLAISPDGRFIAYAGRGTQASGELFLVELSTQARRTLLTGENRPSGELAWSPDGSRLAFVGRPMDTFTDFDEELYVVGTAEGSTPLRLTRDDNDLHSPVWSPDGSRLRFLLEQGSIPGSGRGVEVLADGSGYVQPLEGVPTASTSSTGSVNRLTLSPDARQVAYSIYEYPAGGRVCVRGPSGEHCVLENLNSEVGSIAFSPDGRMIAFSARWPEWQDWELFVAWVDRGGAVMLTDVPGRDDQPVFFPGEAP
ncbi:tolB protein precursor protein [Hyalangium minutum]|uniref:TolB protein protein n=1 Tax=Hyalangium minutum TaxID=394096 RepID=A0A085WIV9_9BACT|nr:tolB protein precursor protein [Hyalangium minutum]